MYNFIEVLFVIFYNEVDICVEIMKFDSSLVVGFGIYIYI